MRDRWTDEETDNPVYADTRGFFKVEIWTDDTARISSACCTPATISIKAAHIRGRDRDRAACAVLHPPGHSRRGEMA
jgi:hypothetical protein